MGEGKTIVWRIVVYPLKSPKSWINDTDEQVGPLITQILQSAI